MMLEVRIMLTFEKKNGTASGREARQGPLSNMVYVHPGSGYTGVFIL